MRIELKRWHIAVVVVALAFELLQAVDAVLSIAANL
jgi:hypothetical protein